MRWDNGVVRYGPGRMAKGLSIRGQASVSEQPEAVGAACVGRGVDADHKIEAQTLTLSTRNHNLFSGPGRRAGWHPPTMPLSPRTAMRLSLEPSRHLAPRTRCQTLRSKVDMYTNDRSVCCDRGLIRSAAANSVNLSGRRGPPAWEIGNETEIPDRGKGRC